MPLPVSDDLKKFAQQQIQPAQSGGLTVSPTLSQWASSLPGTSPGAQFMNNMWNSVNSGLLNLAGGIAEAVPLAFDTVFGEFPVYQQNRDLIANSPYNPASHFQKASDKLHGWAGDLSPMKQYETNIQGAVAKGNWLQAGEMLAYAIAENLPQYAFAGASVALGNPSAGLALMGTSAAGNKYQQVKSNSNMTQEQKIANALLTGFNEAAWEKYFSIPLLEDALKNPALKKQLQQGFMAGVKKVAGGFLQEGTSEVGTQIAGNLIDRRTNNRNAQGQLPGLLEGAVDAGLVGGIMGAGTSGLSLARDKVINGRQQVSNPVQTQQPAQTQQVQTNPVQQQAQQPIGQQVSNPAPKLKLPAMAQEDLYRKAVDVAKANGVGSVAMLQKSLKLTYDEATAMIDRMQREGIIDQRRQVIAKQQAPAQPGTQPTTVQSQQPLPQPPADPGPPASVTKPYNPEKGRERISPTIKLQSGQKVIWNSPSKGPQLLTVNTVYSRTVSLSDPSGKVLNGIPFGSLSFPTEEDLKHGTVLPDEFYKTPLAAKGQEQITPMTKLEEGQKVVMTNPAKGEPQLVTVKKISSRTVSLIDQDGKVLNGIPRSWITFPTEDAFAPKAQDPQEQPTSEVPQDEPQSDPRFPWLTQDYINSLLGLTPDQSTPSPQPTATPTTEEPAPVQDSTGGYKVGDPVKVHRQDGENASLDAEGKPHGLYMSLVTSDNFESPHTEAGSVAYTGTAIPKNPLIAEETKVKHGRFGGMEEGFASAGVSALKQLVSPEEFETLLKMPKSQVKALLDKEFPGNDYSKYHDSYELLEAYASLLARQRGHDAIVLEDSEFPNLSEIVVLKNDIIKWDNEKGEVESTPSEESEVTLEGLTPEKKPIPVNARKLRGVAEAMKGAIEAKRNPATAQQNPTARRASIIANMAREADAMETLQQKIFRVAEAAENGSLPESLKKMSQKTHFEQAEEVLRSTKGDIKKATMYPSIHRDHLRSLLEWTKGVKGSGEARKTLERLTLSEHYSVGLTKQQTEALSKLLSISKEKQGEYSYKSLKESLAGYTRLQKMGIESDEQLQQFLHDYLTVIGEVKAKEADPIKEAERKLIGTKIPGYFPTPKSVVQKMIEAAEIEQGQKVLEPSAGKGNIADMFKELGVTPEVIEVNNTLRDLLKAKGHNVVGTDFLQHTGEYDRIVMNPPFEQGQDIDHVRHAYDLLKPGGRLVAIMSEGPFFRSSKKDTAFREWLDEVGGTSEKLPEGSFKSSERPTGVATRLVVIEKQAQPSEIKPDSTIPIDERTFENVGDRKVKAFQYEHPELKPFIQDQAKILKGELKSSIKGERIAIKDSDGYTSRWTGTKKVVSESIERIQNNTDATYQEIEDALDRIINNHGQENVALAKRIELVIDDMLTQGYKSFDGYDIPPDLAYIEAKNKAEGKKKFTNSRSSFADRGGYADRSSYALRGPSAIELPELVELAREINEGKFPHIVEKMQGALGKFRFKGESGRIDLRADIFLGARVEFEEVKPMKLKETIEKLQEKYKDIPNIVIKQKYDRGNRVFEVSVYRKDPTVAAKVLAHEIGHLVDWLPDKDIKRGNILGRIASLKKHMRAVITAAPQLPWDGKELLPGPSHLTRKTIMDELKNLTQEWKPFDPKEDPEYTSYRYSAVELYADAISVLLNEPELLQEKAPQFMKAFFAYLDAKPEVKETYLEIQYRLTNRVAINEKRLDDIQEMFERDVEFRQRLYEEKQVQAEDMVDTAIRKLIDKDHGVLKHVRRLEKEGGHGKVVAQNARYQLEESKYISAEIENYLYEINGKVLKPLEENGLTVDDLGTYLFLKRVQADREELANPLGHTKETAKETLAAFEKRLGKEKFAKLEKIVERYRDIREELILPRVEEARMYSPDLIDLMQESKDYAKFSVLHYLENRYGKSETARVYQQVGTLAEISNPLVSTALQDISMIRAAKLNEAKAAVLALIQQAAPESIQDAEMVFSQDRKALIAKEPVDPRLGMLTIMVDGKPHSYYVAREVAEVFAYRPFEATKIAQIWATVNQPLRDLLVSKNPFWMVRNVIRDFKTTVKNIPEVSLSKVPKLLGKYQEAYKEAWKAVLQGEISSDIASMRKGYMLTSDRAYSGREKTFDNEIERLVEEFAIDFEAAPQAKGAVRKLYSFLERMGRVSEIGGKIAGYKFLKEFSSRSEKEIGHVLRTRVGTPDYKRQGELQSITNNVFMFSNVGKEGLRSAWESYKDDPGAYIFKTFMFNVLPKLILLGALMGGPDELKEIIKGISEYDKRSYNVIPLGMTEKGKSVYLRIPQDYEGQFWGALFWNLAQGKILGMGGAIDTIGEQNPYSLNPLIQAASDMYQYFVRGVNPQDDFRGRTVIPYYIFKEGGWPATREILQHEWKSLGGSIFYNPDGAWKYCDTTAEKLLQIFPFNVLGTFLKITDYGKVEKENAEKNKKN